VIAVVVALARPVGVDVIIARVWLAAEQDVLLQEEQEKACAVRWRLASRPRVLGREPGPVVVRPDDVVAGVEFLVKADEDRVLAQVLLQRDAHLRGRDVQRHLDGFPAREVVSRLGRDSHVGRVTEQPLGRHLAGRSVGLEVVGQDHIGVAADAGVVWIARGNSVCSCRWCSRSE
jgi:hypothetical protein